MADNFILPGARQDGSNLGVVIAATNTGADAQGRPILAIAPGASVGGATSAKQDTQITAEQAILAKLIAAPATEVKQPALGTATTPSTDVLTTRPPAVTKVMSTAFEASKVLKNTTGALVQLTVFNSGPAQFILVMNSTTVTADGAVTLLIPPIPVAAGQLMVLDFPTPVAFAGCSVSNSSTGTFTKTIGSADCAFFAMVY